MDITPAVVKTVARASCTLLLVTVSSAHSFNRNDVIYFFDQLVSNWSDVSADIWINNNDRDPGVMVGDSIVYTMTASKPAHYTIIGIDSKGSTAILKPEALEQFFEPTVKYVFPPLPDGCEFPISEECERDLNSVVQGEPLGKETVFVIASMREIPDELLGIPAGRDFISLGTNIQASEELSRRITDYSESTGNLLTVGRYQYFVDSDLQISSRSIKFELDSRSLQIPVDDSTAQSGASLISQDIIDRNKELGDTQVVTGEPQVGVLNGIKETELVEQSRPILQPQLGDDESQPVVVESRPLLIESQPLQIEPHTVNDLAVESEPTPSVVGEPIVANDISFESGSSVLDRRGKQQLDVIGSELLDRISREEFPVIALVGHTDSAGAEEKNMKLSRDRALSAKYYLVTDWDLPNEYILTNGKGELRPLVENNSPVNRARNRRVEIFVLR